MDLQQGARAPLGGARARWRDTGDPQQQPPAPRRRSPGSSSAAGRRQPGPLAPGDRLSRSPSPWCSSAPRLASRAGSSRSRSHCWPTGRRSSAVAPEGRESSGAHAGRTTRGAWASTSPSPRDPSPRRGQGRAEASASTRHKGRSAAARLLRARGASPIEAPPCPRQTPRAAGEGSPHPPGVPRTGPPKPIIDLST
jgi:hypothetical protein